MLIVNSLSVHYETTQVIWDVSFRVAEKGITAMLGANGAGKSTVLNTIAGLVEPASGTITFEGRDITSLTPFERVEAGISLVPERRRLFPTMTVEENLEIGAYCSRARRSTGETMKWVTELFPILKKRKKQMAGTLSGGEQQMVAIARGLMSKPKLLMLDEPSVGLAPLVTLEVFRIAGEINKAGVTILILEQNVHHTLRIANTGFVLETGRVVMEGSGEQLINNDHVRRTYLGL